MKYIAWGLVAGFLLLGPEIYQPSPILQNLNQVLEPPSVKHWLGTDHLGRDQLARLLSGGRVSLALALSTVGLSLFVGILFAGLAAWRGAWIEVLMKRSIDLVMAFPGMLLVLVLSGLLGGGAWAVVLGLAASSWPEYARVGFTLIRTANQSPGVQSVHLFGFSHGYLWRRHLLPEILFPILNLASLRLGGTVLTVASLGFLGLGTPQPQAEWGLMVTESLPYYSEAPWLVLSPCLLIFSTVLTCQILGSKPE